MTLGHLIGIRSRARAYERYCEVASQASQASYLALRRGNRPPSPCQPALSREMGEVRRDAAHPSEVPA